MNRKGRNVAASVQAQLLRLSRASKLSLQDLLERYCTERLLYRLSKSAHRSRFVLKGAMLLIVWGEGSSERVTRDLDLPRPVVRAYTKESALSEKFEAIVVLGERNSRMKDYFDI